MPSRAHCLRGWPESGPSWIQAKICLIFQRRLALGGPGLGWLIESMGPDRVGPEKVGPCSALHEARYTPYSRHAWQSTASMKQIEFFNWFICSEFSFLFLKQTRSRHLVPHLSKAPKYDPRLATPGWQRLSSFVQTGRMEPIISALTEEEEEMFRNMMRRVHTIARVRPALNRLYN